MILYIVCIFITAVYFFKFVDYKLQEIDAETQQLVDELLYELKHKHNKDNWC